MWVPRQPAPWIAGFAGSQILRPLLGRLRQALLEAGPDDAYLRRRGGLGRISISAAIRRCSSACLARNTSIGSGTTPEAAAGLISMQGRRVQRARTAAASCASRDDWGEILAIRERRSWRREG